MINDKDIERTFSRFQFEPQLFLKCGKYRWTAVVGFDPVIRRPFEFEFKIPFEAGQIHDGLALETRQQQGQASHRHAVGGEPAARR